MHRRFWIYCILAISMMLLVAGCGQQDNKSKQSQKKTQTAAAKPAPSPALEPPPAPVEPATRPLNKWPYLSADHKVPVADNLLARNFVLILDGSGSMDKVECSGALTKSVAARNAVVAWSSSVPADANLGLVSFHAGSTRFTVLDLAMGNNQQYIDTVNSIRPGGKTPLTAAVKQAFRMLEKQAQRQLGYGEYTIVVVTDGIANNPQTLSGVVNILLAKTPINIYTIGFCIDEKHSLNQTGRTDYRAANNPEQLRQGLKEALAESEEFDLSDFN